MLRVITETPAQDVSKGPTKRSTALYLRDDMQRYKYTLYQALQHVCKLSLKLPTIVGCHMLPTQKGRHGSRTFTGHPLRLLKTEQQML
jgi:hypothetical protein